MPCTPAISRSRSLIAWAVLVVLTCLSWKYGHGEARVTAASLAVLGVIAVAMFKVRIVMREFMELRHAPLAVRVITDLWLVGLGAILVFMALSTQAPGL